MKQQSMTSNSTSKALQYRWLIFFLLALGYILVYFHRLCPAVLAVDLMRDLKAGGSLTGLLGAAYFYPYAIMQLPAGLLSDSWGPRKTITLFFLVAFVGSVMLGLAPSVSWAIAGRTLVGVGVAVVFVPTLKILAEWFHPREFARMTGLLLAVGGIGSLTAASPLVWLSNAFGWRNSFIFVGGFTLLIAIWVGFFVRNRPSDLGWNLSFNIEQKDKIEIGLMKGVKQVLSNPYFWPLAIWFFLDFAIFFSFAGLWGGPYLIHVYGMTKAESGNILNMLAVGLVVGAPALSWLSDKVFKRRKPVLILAAAVMLLMTALLTVYTDQLPVWSLYLIFFGMTGFGNAVGAIGFAMTKELFPIQISGTATGIVNLFPFVGGAIFQPLLGDILERYPKIGDTFTSAGYHAAFITLLVVAILAFVAALFSRETLKKN